MGALIKLLGRHEIMQHVYKISDMPTTLTPAHEVLLYHFLGFAFYVL